MPAFTSDDKFYIAKAQDTQSLSTRLGYALRMLNVSQSELARRIGVKPQIIQYLCSNNVKHSKFLPNIADALGINLEWLVSARGNMTDQANYTSDAKVPIIGWTDIYTWLQGRQNDIKTEGQINSQGLVGDNYFAVIINDSSMIPRFEIGTVLIIEPGAIPHENDFVLAQTAFSDLPIIRQFIKKDNEIILLPLNTALYKEISLSNSDKILGVLRQTFYSFS